MKYIIYRIKAFILHNLFYHGLLRTVWDDTKNHKVSGKKYYFRLPKKRHVPTQVEITDFPMRHAYPIDPTKESDA